MHDVAAWQAGRQLAPFFLPRSSVLARLRLGARHFRPGLLRQHRDRLVLCRLGFLQRQLELLENALDPLRALTERLALELGDLGFQLLDRQLRDDEAVPGGCQLGDFGGKLAALGNQLGIFREHRLANRQKP